MFCARLARAVFFCFPLLIVAKQIYAQTPLGDLVSSDATVKGAVALSAGSTRVMSGSSVQAGMSNASVRLLRGGELRVCQGSSVSLTSSANRAQIMVGMSSGTIETHYPLANSRDSIMTPDFEVALQGPGLFHLAVSTDERGNTCVQSLHGNTGSVKVSELMGDGSYTLKPGEQVIFRAGNAREPGQVVANCGCPAPMPLQSAKAESAQPTAVGAAAAAPPPIAPLISPSPKDTNVTAPPPADQVGSIHVQVDAPFVFRASAPPPPPDAPVEIAQVRLSGLPVLGSTYVQPPQQEVAQAAGQDLAKQKKKKRHGLWGFFASIFKG